MTPVPEIVLPGRAADDQSYPQVDEGEEEHWHQKEQDEGDLVDGEPLDTKKGYCLCCRPPQQRRPSSTSLCSPIVQKL